MGYNRENYKRIRDEYQNKNLRAREDAERRADELHARFPDIAEIDRILADTGMRIFGEAMKGRENLDERIASLRAQNLELRKTRAELLMSRGYPADYSSVKYECRDCMDTGFIGTKMCHCMRERLIKAGYESSGIGRLIETQSFDTFSLDYYRQNSEQYNYMKQVYTLCRDYAEGFVPDTGRNLLFCGTTGLGKTHMSTAIAKTVIERGYDVVYVTIQDLVSDFEYERFYRSYSDEGEPKTLRYFDCDLVIIDDLGAEVSNQFTVSCLYNVINSRINKAKSMIINTNLNENEIRGRYSDRITSRLFGEFAAFRFYGRDIREIKASEK